MIGQEGCRWITGVTLVKGCSRSADFYTFNWCVNNFRQFGCSDTYGKRRGMSQNELECQVLGSGFNEIQKLKTEFPEF